MIATQDPTNNKNKTKEIHVKFFAPSLFSLSLSLVIIAASLSFSPLAASQETRYIRDTLFVPLRSGQSFKHRIVHKGLVSGTPLSILEVSEDETYSMVKTQNGIEGWLQTQYLSDEPSARNQLTAIQDKNAKISSKNSELRKELKSIKKQHSNAKLTVSKLTKSRQGAEKELTAIKAISANAITLDRDNKALLQKKQELQNEVDMLKADNQRLNDNLDNGDFLNGAFAVLIGVFITLLVPRLWPSKSSEWA
ncbi:MAG: SH3 domain protein [Pseudohongiellaceae bacterium]|jgi:SH3 domain protein